MNQSSVNNRVVRVFVSSTFRDMKEEREALMSHTWPALRQFCWDREVEFVEVDLRWGIPEEQATRKHMLKHCLDEVRACRPYFIGLLGERYGWVPGEEALTVDLLEEEPWLAQHRTKSITELEILHGVLNNPEMAGRAFFYLRDPAYAQAQGPEFLPEDATNAARQCDLKAFIRETCVTLKIPVREHYPDPRRVAELVLEDLQAAIDADYTKESIPDPLTREARGHEAFAEVRRRTYIGRPDYFDSLDQHARGEGNPLVLLGESGSGKSALLANWVAHWRTSHPQDLIIQHYIGSTPDSADHWQLMRRIIAEIKRWTDDPEEVPHTHDDLLKTFPVWLAKARSKADRDRVRCILVLDALNQLNEQDHARLLGWLPTHSFAGSLRMVTSTVRGETLQTAQSRGWATVTVEPLTTEERRRMIAAYLDRFRKKLDESRVERLATAPQAENPLYLKILLDELRVTGTHDQLDNRLNEYLKAQDIPSLLQQVLARFQRDYERDRPGLVGDTLGLILVARRGLSEMELLELLKPADQQQLPTATWAPLRASLEELLVDHGGTLNFIHKFSRRAVEMTFVPDEEKANTYRLRLVDYFTKYPVGEYLINEPVAARHLDERPWQLLHARKYSELVELLTDIATLVPLAQIGYDDIFYYWRFLSPHFDIVLRYEEAWEKYSGATDPFLSKYVPDFANTIGRVLQDTGHWSAAATAYNRYLHRIDGMLNPHGLSVQLGRRSYGTCLARLGQYSDAKPVLSVALEELEGLLGPHHPAVLQIATDLAYVLEQEGDIGAAMNLHHWALDGSRYRHEVSPAAAMHALAFAAFLRRTERRQEALEHLQRATNWLEETIGMGARDTLLAKLDLAVLQCEMGIFDQGFELLASVSNALEVMLGSDHPYTKQAFDAMSRFVKSKDGAWSWEGGGK